MQNNVLEKSTLKQYLFGVIVLFLSSACHANIYKCVDELANVRFIDFPCDENETLEKEIYFPQNNINIVDQETRINVYKNTALQNNLLKNAKFENQLADWEVSFGEAFWTDNGGKGKSGGLVFESEEGKPATNIREVRVKQCVLLPKGEEYQFSADFRPQRRLKKPYANRIYSIWYESTDCSGGGQSGQYLDPFPAMPDWQHVSKTNLLPSLGARSISIEITRNGNNSDGIRAYWDNVVFSVSKFSPTIAPPAESPNKKFTLKPGENHVHNSTFDKDIFGWSPSWPTVWDGTHGDGAKGSAKVTSKSTKGSIGMGAFQQCINFGENTSFALSASFKIDPKSTQKGGGRVRVTWMEKEACQGRPKTDNSWSDPIDIAGWQKLKIPNLHRPKNSQSVLVEVIQSVRGPGTFIAYWDDIYFEVVD